MGVTDDDIVEGGDGARLHFTNRFAVREARARWRDLHDSPFLGLGEIDDHTAGPVAVVGLEDSGQWLHVEAVALGNVLGRLTGSLDGARVDRAHGKRGQPRGGRFRLSDTLVREVDTGRAT